MNKLTEKMNQLTLVNLILYVMCQVVALAAVPQTGSNQLGNLNQLLSSYGDLNKLMQGGQRPGGDVVSTIQSGLINSNSNIRTSSNSIGNKSTNNINNVSSKTLSSAYTKQVANKPAATTAVTPIDDDEQSQYQPSMVSNIVNQSPGLPVQQTILKQQPYKTQAQSNYPTSSQASPAFSPSAGKSHDDYQDEYLSDDEEAYQSQYPEHMKKNKGPITREQMELKQRLLDLYEKATNDEDNQFRPPPSKIYKEHLGKVLKALSPRKLASEKVKNVLLSDPLVASNNPYQTDQQQDGYDNYNHEEEHFVSQHSRGQTPDWNQEEYHQYDTQYPQIDYEQEESRAAEMKQAQTANVKNQLDETLDQLVPHLQSQFSPDFIDNLNEVDDSDLSPIELLMKKLIVCSLNQDQCKEGEGYNTFTHGIENPYVNEDSNEYNNSEVEYQNQADSGAFAQTYDDETPSRSPFARQNNQRLYPPPHPSTPPMPAVNQQILTRQPKQQVPMQKQQYEGDNRTPMGRQQQQQPQMMRPRMPQQRPAEPQRATPNKLFQQQPQPLMQNNVQPIPSGKVFGDFPKSNKIPSESNKTFHPMQQMASMMKKVTPPKMMTNLPQQKSMIF